MTVEHPVYRFNMIGQPPMKLDGCDQIEPLYRFWAETNQSTFTTKPKRWPSATSWS